MRLFSCPKWMLQILLVGLLTACGGGGGDSTGTPTGAGAGTGTGTGTGTALPNNGLNPLQKSIQDVFAQSNGGYGEVVSILPAPAVRLSGGNPHYAYATFYSIGGALTEAPQKMTKVDVNLSGSIPGIFGKSIFNRPTGVIVDGAIALPSVTSPTPTSTVERVYLSGGTVIFESLADDNKTVMSKVRIKAFEAIPLTGFVNGISNELKLSPGFSQLFINPSLTKSDSTFLPGSAYIKKFMIRDGDTIFLSSCDGDQELELQCRSSGSLSTKLESQFPFSYKNIPYALADGVLQSYQGLRIWIANVPYPSSVIPTTSYAVVIEVKDRVYRGIIERDGTPIKTKLSDGSVVDYSVGLNAQAYKSLQLGINF